MEDTKPKKDSLRRSQGHEAHFVHREGACNISNVACCILISAVFSTDIKSKVFQTQRISEVDSTANAKARCAFPTPRPQKQIL